MIKIKNAFFIFLLVLFAVNVRDITQVVRAGVSCSVPNTFTNGTTADATQVNANFSALVACLGNAAAAGANSDITSLTGLTTILGSAFGGTQYFWGGTSSGTNTITVTTVTPSSGFSFTPGTRVCFIPGGTNTGAATLNVNGTGAQNLNRRIQSSTGIALGSLVGGELKSASNIVCAVAGGTAYVLEQGVDYVGEIKDFGYAGCPTGWQETNGAVAAVASASFPDINTLYGTTWGTNSGFVVMPDLRGSFTASRDINSSNRITVAGGNFDGTVVGNTQYRQNWTLTEAQLPSVSHTTTGTVTPTLTGTQTVALSGSHNFADASALWVKQAGAGTFTGNTAITTGASPFAATINNTAGFAQGAPSVTVDLTNVAYSAVTANFNNASVTVSAVAGSNFTFAFGSGNSHPIIPNVGVVTKCVKL